MKENKALELSKKFAIDIVALCKDGKFTGVLSKQLLRSGTSIGANIHEANYAHGKADFVSKLRISLKECFETEYWLELLFSANELEEAVFTELRNKAGAIRRILIASIRTVQDN